MLSNYLDFIGLSQLIPKSQKILLNNFVKESFALPFPNLSSEEAENLYTYPVPELSPDGSCSVSKEPAKDEYRLATVLGLPENNYKALTSHQETERLWRLRQLVKKINDLVEADWFGIYRKTKNLLREDILLKEAYIGAFSRAEFPLTKEFAEHSNNSTVGLTGRAVLVQNIGAYKGPYYVCDGKVQSEFCVPILNQRNEIVGIIDVESFQKNFFTPRKILEIAKVCMDLGLLNSFFQKNP